MTSEISKINSKMSCQESKISAGANRVPQKQDTITLSAAPSKIKDLKMMDKITSKVTVGEKVHPKEALKKYEPSAFYQDYAKPLFEKNPPVYAKKVSPQALPAKIWKEIRGHADWLCKEHYGKKVLALYDKNKKLIGFRVEVYPDSGWGGAEYITNGKVIVGSHII